MKLPLLLVPVLVLFGACERHTLGETAPAREFEKHHEEQIEAAKAAKEKRPPEKEAQH